MTSPFTTHPYHFSKTKNTALATLSKDTATKYLIIGTENYKVILPGS